MMAHTPGPWIYSQSMQEGDYLVGTGRKIIARLWGGNEDDARLIAAAPDLLAALETVMPWASKAVADHYNQKQGKRALDIARAAIARARQP